MFFLPFPFGFVPFLLSPRPEFHSFQCPFAPFLAGLPFPFFFAFSLTFFIRFPFSFPVPPHFLLSPFPPLNSIFPSPFVFRFLSHLFPARRISLITYRQQKSASATFRSRKPIPFLFFNSEKSVFNSKKSVCRPADRPSTNRHAPLFVRKGCYRNSAHNGFSGTVHCSGMTSDSAAHLARL